MSYAGYRGSERFTPQNSSSRRSRLLQGVSTQELCSVSPPIVQYGLEDGDIVQPTNVVTLGSYNWVDDKVPTIIIPGSPSVWKSPDLPFQLAQDSGPTFIDQNAHRSPKSAFEPAFRAISVTQGRLDGELSLAEEEIDIVTDRNNLRKLMRFVCANGPNRNGKREFRIDAQLASNNKTLVLTRFDANTVDNSSGFKGYGHSFEEAVTFTPASISLASSHSARQSCLKRTGYHRIIRYDLLGLRFMVRFEVDAMVDDSGQERVDDLTELLGGTSISSRLNQPAAREHNSLVTSVSIKRSDIRHIVHGSMVSHDSLLELKTIKSRFSVVWPDVYPQLFLSQTPLLKVGRHLDGGIFEVRTYTKDSPELLKIHSGMRPDFRALVELLSQMRAIAVRYKDMNQALSFSWGGDGDIKVRVVESRRNLLSAKDLSIF